MESALGVVGAGWFALAALALNFTPGPDMACVAARAAAGGLRAGLAAAAGVAAGCLIHLGLALAGLSALLAASQTAYSLVKWAGAAYLIYVGVGLFLGARKSADPTRPDSPARPAGPARAFVDGLLTNALNPKVALFFVAFLPQFIDTAHPRHVLGLAALALAFNITGTLVNIAVALAVSAGRRRFTFSATTVSWVSRGAGVLFVFFGLRLLLAERPTSWGGR